MTQSSGRLARRIAVVTGAAGGIGSGIAKAYAAEGAVLALVDRNAKKLAEVVDAIAAEGGSAQAFTTELRDPASIAATFSQINEQVGSPDILVNNAGIDTTSNVVDMPTALWDEMIEINLRSVFLCTQRVLAGHGGAQMGPDHKHRFATRAQGRAADGSLCCGEGGRYRLHPIACL